jgi:membrane protein implicated in regulation of membrane protease activity
MENEEFSVIKKLVWMNIMLTWWATTGVVTIFFILVLPGWVLQCISFLLINLFSYLAWTKYDKEVRSLIK